jgi:hypothetical protein
MKAENRANRASEVGVPSCPAGKSGSRRVQRADKAMTAPESIRPGGRCGILLSGVGQQPTAPEQAGAIDPTVCEGFPSESTLRAAQSLADSLGRRARRDVADLFDRAARVSGLLKGLGLACSATDPATYSPGTWTLAVQCDGQRFVFVVSGIRTKSGGATSARMSAEVFSSACRAWRAIAKAAGVDEREKPPAAEWRQIWWGVSSKRRSVVGVRNALHRDFMIRWNGGDHDSK